MSGPTGVRRGEVAGVIDSMTMSACLPQRLVFRLPALPDRLPAMGTVGAALILMAVVGISALAQTTRDSNFKLALPDHRGQLRWTADGFKVVESSAKPNGHEIGIRGKDQSGRLTFLAFLFLVPDQASLTSAKCRDSALEPEKKGNPTLRILGVSDSVQSGTLPVSLVNYTSRDRTGKTVYMVRGFVATGDICGDLEFYSDTSISAAIVI
jgi:hypothetical protein